MENSRVSRLRLMRKLCVCLSLGSIQVCLLSLPLRRRWHFSAYSVCCLCQPKQIYEKQLLVALFESGRRASGFAAVAY